jgi:hypothetical protein
VSKGRECKRQVSVTMNRSKNRSRAQVLHLEQPTDLDAC